MKQFKRKRRNLLSRIKETFFIIIIVPWILLVWFIDYETQQIEKVVLTYK